MIEALFPTGVDIALCALRAAAQSPGRFAWGSAPSVAPYLVSRWGGETHLYPEEEVPAASSRACGPPLSVGVLGVSPVAAGCSLPPPLASLCKGFQAFVQGLRGTRGLEFSV